jgi:hypothetical protein
VLAFLLIGSGLSAKVSPTETNVADLSHSSSPDAKQRFPELVLRFGLLTEPLLDKRRAVARLIHELMDDSCSEHEDSDELEEDSMQN